MKHTSEGPIGLRILIQSSEYDSNTVFRPPLKSIRRTSSCIIVETSFLKACFLCNKWLNPEKDIFMYKGDQGFCSVECRCRQIYLDEIKELEAATKEMLASSRYYCRSDGKVNSRHRRAIRAAVL
ncbi:hypothetical protein ACHQM5_029588 [Ranunculus cassubicifolius]